MSIDEMLDLERFIKSLMNPNQHHNYYEDPDYYSDLEDLKDLEELDDDLDDLDDLNDNSNKLNLADFPYQIIIS